MKNNCLHCNKETTNKKFCSSSCSASYNNKGIRRHGKVTHCYECGTKVRDSTAKYCSRECFSVARIKSNKLSKRNKTPESVAYHKALNAHRQSIYRQKQYRKYSPGADKKLIVEIYKNCPEGYEVDHIIPLSKGGLHHQDNLQYLPREENRKKSNKIMVGATGFEPISKPL